MVSEWVTTCKQDRQKVLINGTSGEVGKFAVRLERVKKPTSRDEEIPETHRYVETGQKKGFVIINVRSNLAQ